MSEETRQCPYCDSRCDADFVDVGVGMIQCGPYHCQQCKASEIGPHDKERILTADEKRTGWYAPGAPAGSSANVIGGQIVSHQVMKATYQDEFRGNPLWHDKGYVDDWWRDIREPNV
jgi:hypothetical protein